MTHDPDVLIARVVDGEATSEQWALFCRMAEINPSLWRDLAESQHQQAELSALVTRAVAIADQVEAPVAQEMALRFNQRLRAAVIVGGWGGWLAAAAALLIAWGMGLPAFESARPAGPESTMQAGLGGTIGDALQTYLDRGRESGQVVGELPERILIDARPISGETGRYEVIYLRQIMERSVVNEFYGFGSDEAGRLTPVRLDMLPVNPM